MDYKIFISKIIRSVLTLLVIIIFFRCSNPEKNNLSNTYYVEFINFNDSLKKFVANDLFGKVTYHKNNQLIIVSLNYETDNYPDMHYFKNISEVGENIKSGIKKIQIEQVGNYSKDSINYSLQKYSYNNKQWVKVSDMGVIKKTTTFKYTGRFDIKELINPIVNSIVTYTY
jgi:hypothetical protein